jgi:anthranilate/para-aminobenzoate synthase component II
MRVLLVISDRKAYEEDQTKHPSSFGKKLHDNLNKRQDIDDLVVVFSECRDDDMLNCVSSANASEYDYVVVGGSHFTPGTSGLPKKFMKRNIELVNACKMTKTPFLGICFGCEVLAVALGGKLRKRSFTHHGCFHKRVFLSTHSKLFGKEEEYRKKEKETVISLDAVYEFHDYEISSVPLGSVTGIHLSGNDDDDEEDEIAVIEATRALLFGVQWHPEASGATGDFILDMFFSL